MAKFIGLLEVLAIFGMIIGLGNLTFSRFPGGTPGKWPKWSFFHQNWWKSSKIDLFWSFLGPNKHNNQKVRWVIELCWKSYNFSINLIKFDQNGSKMTHLEIAVFLSGGWFFWADSWKLPKVPLYIRYIPIWVATALYDPDRGGGYPPPKMGQKWGRNRPQNDPKSRNKPKYWALPGPIALRNH